MNDSSKNSVAGKNNKTNIDNRNLLDLERSQVRDGLWTSELDGKTCENSPTSVQGDGFRNRDRKDIDAHLRQSSLCESRSSDSGNTKTELSGHDDEAERKEPIQSSNSLQNGTSTDHSKNNGEKVLQELHSDKAKNLSIKEKSIVEVSEAGFLKAKTIEGQFRIAQALFSSGMVPKSYKNAQQVFAGCTYAIELGLKPFQGLRNIAMINGQPNIWGDLPLGLARRTGELESIEEFIIDKDYKRLSFENKNINAAHWAAICIIKRKGQPKVEAFFTMDDAKAAGLLSRDNVWQTYPKIMLARRARSQALKTAFADALAGISIAEYDSNYLPEGPEVRNVSPTGVDIKNTAGELNNLFQDEQPVQQ